MVLIRVQRLLVPGGAPQREPCPRDGRLAELGDPELEQLHRERVHHEPDHTADPHRVGPGVDQRRDDLGELPARGDRAVARCGARSIPLRIANGVFLPMSMQVRVRHDAARSDPRRRSRGSGERPPRTSPAASRPRARRAGASSPGTSRSPPPGRPYRAAARARGSADRGRSRSPMRPASGRAATRRARSVIRRAASAIDMPASAATGSRRRRFPTGRYGAPGGETTTVVPGRETRRASLPITNVRPADVSQDPVGHGRIDQVTERVLVRAHGGGGAGPGEQRELSEDLALAEQVVELPLGEQLHGTLADHVQELRRAPRTPRGSSCRRWKCSIRASP